MDGRELDRQRAYLFAELTREYGARWYAELHGTNWHPYLLECARIDLSIWRERGLL